MNDPAEKASPNPDADPQPVAPPLPVPADKTAHTPVSRVEKPAFIAVVTTTKPAVKEDDRRDFFGDAMREALGPLTGILERKINPLLAALEAIPDDVDRFTNVTLPAIGRTLDQPQAGAHHRQEADARVPLTILRPPGAQGGGAFESLCSRCGKCVDVCPASAIKLDANQLTGDGLPYIVAREQPCVVCSDLSCMVECPTSALKLIDRLAIKMGTARVDHDLCLRNNGEDCRLCVEACPITGAEAGGGPDAIFINAESGRVVVRKNVCVGCGLCENRCPTEPAAIQVSAFRERRDPIIA